MMRPYRMLGGDEAPLPPDVEATGAAVLRAAREVARELGLGMRERVYQEALALALCELGRKAQREVPVTVSFRGRCLGQGYRIDLVVDDRVAVEVKSAGEMHPAFETQLLTYMRGAGFQLGYVLNFGMPTLAAGIRRKIFSR